MVLSVVTTNQCLCNKNVYITTNHSCTSCVQVQNLSVCLCYGQLKATFQQTITLYTRSHVCSANYVYLPWIFTIWSHCPEIFFFFLSLKIVTFHHIPDHTSCYITLSYGWWPPVSNTQNCTYCQNLEVTNQIAAHKLVHTNSYKSHYKHLDHGHSYTLESLPLDKFKHWSDTQQPSSIVKVGIYTTNQTLPLLLLLGFYSWLLSIFSDSLKSGVWGNRVPPDKMH